ncbi:MAG TPA: type II toxin-antitoxin system VapC family toxin [Gaiellaceae bacterium]|nr:type II toxin-antitoxin system VapC family toxin [Gaiellaceae bacterium]
MSYLLDTNVVSELRKKNRDERVVAWLHSVDSRDLYVSVLAIGEIRLGIERLRHRGDHPQADALEPWLQTLRVDFADRTLPVSSSIAERWGQLNAERSLPIIDGLMAATALEHDLTLVTRDAATLGASGVRLIDPWVA